MRQIEASAKKVEQAVEEGLRILGVSEDEVKVEILSTGGWFRKAKVRLTVVDENGNPIEDKDLSSVTEEDLKSFGISETPVFDTPKKNKEKPNKSERKGEQKGNKPEQKSEKVDRKGEQKGEQKSEQKGNKPEQKAEKIDRKGEQKSERKAEQKSNKPEQKPEQKGKKTFEKKSPESPRPMPVMAENLPPVDEEMAKKAKDYLEKLLEKMSIEGKVEMKTDGGVIALDIVTEDGSIIGHHGEVLDAIQTLTKRATYDGDDKYIHLVVDSQNYRAKRESSLIALAEKMASKCIRTGKKIV